MLSSAVERLKACDDAFRKQLEQERQAHEQQIQTLTNEKQREIEQANTRVRHDELSTPCIHWNQLANSEDNMSLTKNLT